MREIKFRAWDGERFLYFDLFDLAIRQPTEYLFREASTFPQYESIPRHIDGLVIEQYTGLKDKNGTEIYEGDIVSLSEDYTDQIRHHWNIIYELRNFMWALHYGNGEFWRRLSFSALNPFDGDFEVIGNIHENKELVK